MADLVEDHHENLCGARQALQNLSASHYLLSKMKIQLLPLEVELMILHYAE